MKKIYPILFALMLSLVAAQAVTYTTITATTLTGNAGVKAPTSWVTLQGNASYDQILWPDNYDLLIGVNVTGVQGTSTVRPLNVTYGTSAGAFRGSIGNLSVQMPNAGVRWIGPLEKARFMNSTGYLRLSSYNIAGTVTAIKIPMRGIRA